ncbi:MAG TPA: host attachment protein [Chromatiales bacterium]|nr:host attachment protein [Thiotrichales bacterium]HIP69275.1 host attachment protein [Chromatiales bacterium]
MTIWVVVADASKARIFSAESRNGVLVETADYLHAESRMKGRDLETDDQGRAFDSGGQGRHAMGKEQEVSEREAEIFARELCEEIDKAAKAGQFKKLYIIATPKFLGHLRAQMSTQAKSLIAGEVSKDLVNHEIQDIRKHLGDFL